MLYHVMYCCLATDDFQMVTVSQPKYPLKNIQVMNKAYLLTIYELKSRPVLKMFKSDFKL